MYECHIFIVNETNIIDIYTIRSRHFGHPIGIRKKKKKKTEYVEHQAGTTLKKHLKFPDTEYLWCETCHPMSSPSVSNL